MSLSRTISFTFLTLFTLTLTLIGRPADAAVARTYLALGDSLAFGYTDPAHLAPSFGDQGYVALYADWLGTRNGGVRPNVVNLAIPTETTSSFFTGGLPATALNLNYPNTTTSQNSLMLTKIASEKAAGRVISDVTISLGANDFFALALSPGFMGLSTDQQAALVVQTLSTVQTNFATLLAGLRTELPTANLILVGLYNPFPAVPNSPFTPLAGQAIGALNQLMRAQAAFFGGRFVDTYMPFMSHEAEYTNILTPDVTGQPNVHPNPTGYEVIAEQLTGVPEPSSLALAGVGLACLLALVRRRSPMRSIA